MAEFFPVSWLYDRFKNEKNAKLPSSPGIIPSILLSEMSGVNQFKPSYVVYNVVKVKVSFNAKDQGLT